MATAAYSCLLGYKFQPKVSVRSDTELHQFQEGSSTSHSYGKTFTGEGKILRNSVMEEASISVLMTAEEDESGSTEATDHNENSEHVVVGIDDESLTFLMPGMTIVMNGEEHLLQLDPCTGGLIAYPVVQQSMPDDEHTEHDEEPEEDIGTENAAAVESDVVKLSEQENNAAEGLLGLADGHDSGSGATLTAAESSATGIEIDNSNCCEEQSISGGYSSTELTNSMNVESSETACVSGDELYVQNVSSTGESFFSPESASSSHITGSDKPTRITFSTPNQAQNFLASLGLPVKRGRGRPRRNPLPPNAVLTTIMPSSSSSSPVSHLAQLPPLLPKPAGDETQTSIIIEQEDGTEKHIVLSMPARSLTSAVPNPMVVCPVVSDVGEQPVAEIVTANVPAIDSLPADATSQSSEQKGSDPSSVTTQVIFMTKKEPVKIGLRASEKDLIKLKCTKCDFQAYYSQQLQDHINKNHANQLDDVLRCKCCSFVCFNDELLVSHYKEMHPRCICPDCGFTSEHVYVVKRHQQRHDVRGCECTICGRRYKDQYILKMHVKMRHMEPEILYQCNICSKLFTRKAHLKRHQRIHNPDKPFKCPHCDYRGCERSDITKHVLIHDTPQHECDICGKAFRHFKNKELHMKRHRGQRDYKCICCDFYGYTFTDIRKHQERKHAGLMHAAAVCNVCGSSFKSEETLQLHRQSGCQLLAAQMLPVEMEAPENMTSDLFQYVTNGGIVQLVDGGDLSVVEGQSGHVIVNADHRVGLDQFNGDGMSFNMDESLSGAGSDQLMDADCHTPIIIDSVMTTSFDMLQQ